MRIFSRVYLALVFTFLIGIHEGRVAVWVEPKAEPDQVFPLAAEMLPPADQQSLRSGIRVNSNQQLEAILEDLLS